MVSMFTIYVIGTVAMVLINGIGLRLLDLEDEELTENAQKASKEERVV